MTDHPHHLIEVCVEDHPVKDTRQHIRCRLKAGWSRQSQYPVIDREKRRETLDGLSETVWAYLFPCD